MAFKDIEKEKKEVFAVLLAIGVIVILFLWRFVLTVPEPTSPPMATTRRVPEIDFDYLKSDEFEMLRQYEPITPLPEESMGRNNPFLPY